MRIIVSNSHKTLVTLIDRLVALQPSRHYPVISNFISHIIGYSYLLKNSDYYIDLLSFFIIVFPNDVNSFVLNLGTKLITFAYYPCNLSRFL